jgi:hypothetical protein
MREVKPPHVLPTPPSRPSWIRPSAGRRFLPYWQYSARAGPVKTFRVAVEEKPTVKEQRRGAEFERSGEGGVLRSRSALMIEPSACLV